MSVEFPLRTGKDAEGRAGGGRGEAGGGASEGAGRSRCRYCAEIRPGRRRPTAQRGHTGRGEEGALLSLH